MKYFGAITTVQDLPASPASGDLFYVTNDCRFLTFDGEAWGPYTGTAADIVAGLGDTSGTPFAVPADLAGEVANIIGLPASASEGACYRVKAQDVALIYTSNGWVQFAQNVGNVKVVDIVNSCNSEATDKPLSAAQGKVLADAITEIELAIGDVAADLSEI